MGENGGSGTKIQRVPGTNEQHSRFDRVVWLGAVSYVLGDLEDAECKTREEVTCRE